MVEMVVVPHGCEDGNRSGMLLVVDAISCGSGDKTVRVEATMYVGVSKCEEKLLALNHHCNYHRPAPLRSLSPPPSVEI